MKCGVRVRLSISARPVGLDELAHLSVECRHARLVQIHRLIFAASCSHKRQIDKRRRGRKCAGGDCSQILSECELPKTKFQRKKNASCQCSLKVASQTDVVAPPLFQMDGLRCSTAEASVHPPSSRGLSNISRRSRRDFALWHATHMIAMLPAFRYDLHHGST